MTDAVRAQNAVRESEQRLQQLANTIPQLAWMAETDGIVHWYYDRWLEFAGTSHDDMMESGWMSIVHPDDVDALTSQWRRSAETGALYEATGRLRARNGAYHTFFIRAAALRDEAGNIVRWFGTNTDVLQEAIEQTRPLVETKGQAFVADMAGADYIVNGDKTRLIQIFANILNNAAKYTPNGGTIALRLAANAERPQVTVEDSGAGITTTLLPHIFELFTQGERLPDRAQGGLGLGLSLVKRLVELHDGKRGQGARQHIQGGFAARADGTGSE